MIERCSKTFAKRIHRVGPILAIVLVWQIHPSPLLGQFGRSLQPFSQVDVNGGSTTSFTVNNPSTTETITVDAQLYFPDGTPLADGQVVLGPGATDTLSFGDPQAALTSGWAELKSDGAFIATEFFQLSIGGQLKPRVGVLPSAPSDEIRFLGFVNPQFTSGLAVSNPSSTEATEITIRAKDTAGFGAPLSILATFSTTSRGPRRTPSSWTVVIRYSLVYEDPAMSRCKVDATSSRVIQETSVEPSCFLSNRCVLTIRKLWGW